MVKCGIFRNSCVIALLCLWSYNSHAQEKYPKTDSFFLLKQKGLLGKLGKSISRTPQPEPQKIVNPFLPYANKIIRSIEIFPLGFDRNIDDTTLVKDTKMVKLANRFHHDTRYNVIRKNLFFKTGERFLPLLVSDNETFLRNQPFLRDARIHVAQADDAPDSVDIVVFTRDVFSIGARVNMNTRRFRTELREENLFGTGNEFAINALFDRDRHPEGGLGGEIVFRNIGGGFLNWYGGFNNFKEAFNSGRLEEASYYMRIEKPFVNRYTQWTANMEIARNETFNAYLPDSSYRADYQYRYHKMDLWAGYNIGYNTKKGYDSEKRLRHFVAGRIFYTKFEKQPVKYDSVFNYSYADKNGVLFSYTLYRQNFYRTNYLYAFGRSEDVPVGLSASIIAGWANIEDRKTPYYGIDLEVSTFTRHSIYSDYKIRLGGFHNGSRFEDANLLLAVDHFTKLRKLGSKWTNRNFLNFSYAKQFNYRYNDPLFLRSDFGLPYYNNIVYPANQRLTTRLESDFYNINKILGFRFAPFAFGDVSFLKRLGTNFSKLKGYPAIGAGIRTRNENLIFETIELRGYYFPVTIDNMKNWKIDLNTRVRFRINNSLIKKPDFIIVN